MIFNTKEDKRSLYFFQCLKESYVKALGVGIGFEVKRLSFDLRTPVLEDRAIPACTTSLKVDGQARQDWTFEETVIDNHCIAVACHRALQVQYWF